HTAEMSNSSLGRGLNRRLVRHVHEKRLRLAAGGGNFLSHCFQLGFVACSQCNPGPHFCQGNGASAPDPLGCDRNKRCLTFKIFHALTLSCERVRLPALHRPTKSWREFGRIPLPSQKKNPSLCERSLGSCNAPRCFTASRASSLRT